MHARRSRARDVRLGRARDERNGPALRNAWLALEYRANVAGDHRSARLHCRGSAVELRDAEAPDFLLVSRLERKHEVLLPCSRDCRGLMLSVYENATP